MKTMYNHAFSYAIAGIIGGVFFREFTKWNGFTGMTALAKVHGHLFILGMLFFLIVAIICNNTPIQQQKRFHTFLVLYDAGLSLTAVMLVVRGITQVLGLGIPKGIDAAISGFAGIGHILLSVGLLTFLDMLRKTPA